MIAAAMLLETAASSGNVARVPWHKLIFIISCVLCTHSCLHAFQMRMQNDISHELNVMEWEKEWRLMLEHKSEANNIDLYFFFHFYFSHRRLPRHLRCSPDALTVLCEHFINKLMSLNQSFERMCQLKLVTVMIFCVYIYFFPPVLCPLPHYI